MADIFVSYAEEDRATVEKCAGVLEAKGWSVWWDRAIPVGRTFHEVIEEEPAAAECVVVVWSSSSVGSQ